MKWKEISKNYRFSDGSVVKQRHQTHLYDCYKLTYIDNDGKQKELIASKDHILKVNISKWPNDAKNEVRQFCVGNIPIKEEVDINIIGYTTPEQKNLIAKYIIDEIDDSHFKNVEEISEPTLECYIFDFDSTFKKEVLVKRTTVEDEPQRIDDDNWWIPLEGLAYLFNKYGELEI